MFTCRVLVVPFFFRCVFVTVTILFMCASDEFQVHGPEPGEGVVPPQVIDIRDSEPEAFVTCVFSVRIFGLQFVLCSIICWLLILYSRQALLFDASDIQVAF